MEGFFDTFAARVKSRVGFLAFRGGGRTKALVIVPTVHPGPFGHLGGSNLPEKLLGNLEDLTPAVLVAHGPSTHDQNLATSGEVDKIGAKVRGMLAHLAYDGMVSPMVRVHHGAASVCAQIFGATALVVASQAPKPTDDLDAATGHAAVAAARAAGVEEALVVDAHNYLESGSGMVNFGSEESYDIVKAVEEAMGLALKQVGRGLRVGYAGRRTLSDPLRGLGPMGIQALVVEAGGQRTAYLLYDGNNMVPGLREEILAEIKGLGDEAEVLTTDNHVVNAFIPGFNPVGLRWDHRELVEMSRDLVKAALGDLEPVEAGTAADFVEDVHIWGNESAVRLTTAIQSIMAGLRINAAVSLALGVAISLVALLVIR
jgi:putative membrane protein